MAKCTFIRDTLTGQLRKRSREPEPKDNTQFICTVGETPDAPPTVQEEIKSVCINVGWPEDKTGIKSAHEWYLEDREQFPDVCILDSPAFEQLSLRESVEFWFHHPLTYDEYRMRRERAQVVRDCHKRHKPYPYEETYEVALQQLEFHSR